MKPPVLVGLALVVFLVLLAVLWPGDRSPAPAEPTAAASGGSTPAAAGAGGSAAAGPSSRRLPPSAAGGLERARVDRASLDVNRDRPSLLAQRSRGRAIGREGDPNAAGTDAPPPPRWKLDREGIQAAVRAALPEIQECYEGWIQHQPNLGGRVVVEFKVVTAKDDPQSGEVTALSLKETGLDHAPMEGCVLSVFQGLSFEAPASGGEMTVRYPIQLSNTEASDPPDGGG